MSMPDCDGRPRSTHCCSNGEPAVIEERDGEQTMERYADRYIRRAGESERDERWARGQ